MQSTIPALLRDAHTHWGDAAHLARIGRELQSRARFEDAAFVLERAVALAPEASDAWAELSYTDFRSMRGDQGRAVLRRGIAASASDWLKTVLANFTPDPEAAKTLWNEVADSKEPDVIAARIAHDLWQAEDKAVLLAELTVLQSAHPQDERIADALLWTLLSIAGQQAIEGFDARAAARPLLDRRRAEDPARIGSWWFEAQFARIAEDWEGLLSTTTRALEHLPDEETVMQLRGRAYRELGDLERAAQWFLRAIGAKPSFVGARVDLGRLYEKQGQMELAEEIFREIPVAHPDYPAGPLSVALFLARQDRMDEARSLFAKAWPTIPAPMKAGLQHDPEVARMLEQSPA